MAEARVPLSAPNIGRDFAPDDIAEAQATGSASISFDISSKGFAGWLSEDGQGLAKLQAMAGHGEDGVHVQAPGKPENAHGDGLDSGNMNAIGVRA